MTPYGNTNGFAQMLVLGLLMGGMVACAGPPDAAPEVRIGVIAPLSGALVETVGQPTQETALLAVEQINAGGGLRIGGRRHTVVLRFEDNADNAETSMQQAHKLINQDEVVALVGLNLSRNAIPVANVAEQAGIPMITPTATNPDVTRGKRFAFRVAFTDDFQGRAMAHFAREDLAAQTAAVLYDVASAYNQNIATVFRDAFEENGGRVVAFEAYTTGEQDFGDPLARMHPLRPDVLLLPNYVDEVPSQVAQARQRGLTATILGSDAWDEDVFAGQPLFEGSFFTDTWHPDVSNEPAQAFIEAYRQAYDQRPGGAAALTYDAFGLLFEAIETQASFDGEQIREALGGTENYRGVTGLISYRGSGDPVKSAVIIQIKNGQARFYKSIDP